MFEKTAFRPTTYYKKAANDLMNVFLQDPMLGDYIRQSLKMPAEQKLAYEDLMMGLAKIGHSISATEQHQTVREQMTRLNNLMTSLHQIDESINVNDEADVSNEDAQIGWDNMIYELNQLNGYNAPAPGRARPANEVTVMEKNTSFGSQVHDYLAEEDYGPVQDSPEGKMMLHMSNLVSDCMLKMANVQREVQMKNFARDHKEPLAVDEKAEQAFFENLKPEEKEFVVLSDEDFTKRMQSLEQKKEKYRAELNKTDEQLNAMIEEDPATRVFLEDEEKTYASEMDVGRDSFNTKLNSEMQALEDKLKAEQAAAQQEFNEKKRKIEEHNADISKQIETAVNKGKAEMEELKTTRTTIEQQLRQEQKKALGDNKLNQTELQQKKTELEEKIKAQNQLLADEKKLSDQGFMPPQEHFNDLERNQYDIRTFESLRNDLTQLGEKAGGMGRVEQTYAKMNDYLSDLKKIEGLQAKVAKAKMAVAEQEKKTVGVQSGEKRKFSRKENSTLTAQGKAERELETAQNQFNAQWGLMTDIANTFSKYKNEHNDYFKEFNEANQKSGNRKNISETLDKLVADRQKKAEEFKKPYQEYYNKKAYVETHKVSPEEVTRTETELKETDRLLDVLDEKKFQDKLNKAAAEFPTEEEAAKQRDFIEKRMTNKVNELKGKLIAEEPDVKIPTNAEIQSRVAGERKQRTDERQNNLDKLVRDHMKGIKENFFSKQRDEMREKSAQMADKFEEGIKRLKNVRQEAKNLHEKRNEIAEKVQQGREKWAQVKNSRSSYSDMLKNRIDAMTKDMDKGTKKGHTNSPEFEAMRTALQKTSKYIVENESLLKDGNIAAKNGLQKMMKSIENSADAYKEAKAGGIHWISSNMRHVRLQFADDLVNFSRTADKEIETQYENETAQMNVTQAAMKNNLKPVETKSFQDFTKQGLQNAAQKVQPNKQIEVPVVQNPQLQNPQMGGPQ